MINEVDASRTEASTKNKNGRRSESGQAIVLMALLLVVLLALVGLSVDVGLIYARQSQLALAVDASALAGVTELNGAVDERQAAVDRAAEFLHVNNLPAASVTGTFANDIGLYAVDKPSNATLLGARTFSITSTWEVPLYFLRVLGFESVPVTASATAAYFPRANIYASRRVEFGALSTSNQAIFGPHVAVDLGDPFSNLDDPPGSGDPRAVAFRDRWHNDVNDRTYHYRILVPPGYEDHSDIVRIELFDPDSINQPNNFNGGTEFQATVVHTDATVATGTVPATELLECASNQKNPCLIDTGERGVLSPPLSAAEELDRINLWWFARIDENRGTGAAPGNPAAGGSPPNYDAHYNTVTLYELFYYRRDPDGTVVRVPLASYYGQSGDFVVQRNGFPRDATFSSIPDQHTDMHWVSPGALQAYDFDFDGDTVPDIVPAACGSPTGGDFDPVTCPGGSAAGPGRGFEISLSNHLLDILVDGATGSRYIYMDVTTLSGGSENGFEVWGGPPDYVNTVSANVNTRNVQVVNAPNSHPSRGVSVFGLGHLPMNSNVTFAVDIPLLYVGPEYSGTSLFVSLYDSDAGASPPIIFYFDSISESDWSLTFSDPFTPDPDGVVGRCIIGSCGTQWIDPAYRIDIPTLSEECAALGTQNVCTPFYGGRLMARYKGGNNDTYHWNINLTGLPYLTQ